MNLFQPSRGITGVSRLAASLTRVSVALIFFMALFFGQNSQAQTKLPDKTKFASVAQAQPGAGKIHQADKSDSGLEDSAARLSRQDNAAKAATTTNPPVEPSPLGESLSHGNENSMGVAMTAFLRMIVVLVGVLLLAYLLLHKGLGKLSSKLSHGRLIKVIDRVGLEPKKTLYVVEVADHHYLIGASDSGISHLATLDDAQSQASFSALMHHGKADKGLPKSLDMPQQERDAAAASTTETVSEEGANNG